MSRNPILIGFAVIVAAVVIGVFILSNRAPAPRPEPPGPREPGPVAGNTPPAQPTPTATHTPPPPPTPTIPPVEPETPGVKGTPEADEPFAEDWSYRSVIGDVVEIDLGTGRTRAIRIGKVFADPDGVEATLVEYDRVREIVIAERVSDKMRAEVPKAAPEGPEVVLYYPFDQPEPIARDMSPNARNGTLFGVTYVSDGRRGSAALLDGTASIEIPVEGLDLSGPMSVSVWIKAKSRGPNIDSEWARIIQLGDPSGQTPGFGVATGNRNGRIVGFYQESYTSREYARRTPVPLSAGMWHHVAMVYDGGTSVTVYVDGMPMTEQASHEDRNWQAGEGRHFTIGKKAGADSNYFNGMIDELFVFGDALSPEQVMKVYRMEY